MACINAYRQMNWGIKNNQWNSKKNIEELLSVNFIRKIILSDLFIYKSDSWHSKVLYLRKKSFYIYNKIYI